MPSYRRWFVPGGTYFFTVVTYGRARWLCEPAARELLREAFRECRVERPFEVVAIVLLPDHLHAVWALPRGDADFSGRWAFIKRTFSARWLAEGGSEGAVSAGLKGQRRRGVWQPRFWEHLVRDEVDLERHVDYVHYNPVKHGLCPCPRDWEFSSFRRFVTEGQYGEKWGCREETGGEMDFRDIEGEVGE